MDNQQLYDAYQEDPQKNERQGEAHEEGCHSCDEEWGVSISLGP